MANYYDCELERLDLYDGETEQYNPTIRIWAPNGNSTSHLNVTREQVERIIGVLKEGEE